MCPIKSVTNQSFEFLSSASPVNFNFTEGLALVFNNTVNPLTFTQGYIRNLNGINCTTDNTQFLIQNVGGTSQTFKFLGTSRPLFGFLEAVRASLGRVENPRGEKWIWLDGAHNLSFQLTIMISALNFLGSSSPVIPTGLLLIM